MFVLVFGKYIKFVIDKKAKEVPKKG